MKGCVIMDIMNEIRNLPNLGYDYCKDNGKFCFVVLGGKSCPTTEEYRFYDAAIHYNSKLLKLYENKPFTEETKDAIIYYMKKMISACDARMPGTHTLAQQSAYVDALSNDEREQIEEQIIMYKECYAIYQDSFRRK